MNLGKASLKVIPKTNAAPTPSNPNINNQSTKGFPARPWKKSAKGPYVAFLRYPNVGEAPASHAFEGTVAKPKPNVLSKKAHKKITPIATRSKPR